MMIYSSLTEVLNGLLAIFSSGEEEDEGGLSPVKDDDEVWRKYDRKTSMISVKEEYHGTRRNQQLFHNL